MTSPSSRDAGEKLFLEHLAMIEDVIRFACSRTSMRDADAEDFASDVRMRLVENDFAVLRKYEARAQASLKTFITTVVLHMALDRRVHQWGRWRSSTEAKRLGPVAVELERLIHRDGRTFAEALPFCRRLDPTITVETLRELADRFPSRAHRPRDVDLDTATERQLVVSGDTVSNPMLGREREQLARKAAAIIDQTVAGFAPEDRLLFRLHFAAEMRIAEIARVQNTDSKRLYPRLHRGLREIRERLEAAGIDAEAAEEIVQLGLGLDLGWMEKNPDLRPSEVEDDTPGRIGGGSR